MLLDGSKSWGSVRLDIPEQSPRESNGNSQRESHQKHIESKILVPSHEAVSGQVYLTREEKPQKAHPQENRQYGFGPEHRTSVLSSTQEKKFSEGVDDS